MMTDKSLGWGIRKGIRLEEDVVGIVDIVLHLGKRLEDLVFGILGTDFLVDVGPEGEDEGVEVLVQGRTHQIELVHQKRSPGRKVWIGGRILAFVPGRRLEGILDELLLFGG